MSSLPLILSLIDELERESNSPSYYGNDFGLGLHPHHIHRSGSQNSHRHRYNQVQQHHPHDYHHHEPSLSAIALPLALLSQLGNEAAQRQLSRRSDTQKDAARTAIGKDGFQVCMDVAQFKPNELNVKVVDNFVVVEGKHEERADDHGFISRHFVRRYVLPKDYDADKVVSTLSSDGVLTLQVPKPQIEQKSNERVIQIQQVGPAHLNVKANTEEKSVGQGEEEGAKADAAAAAADDKK